MAEKSKDDLNIKTVKSSYIKRKMDIQKLTLNLKTRPFGLHRHNYVNSIKPVNLISANILSIFLKRKS